MREIHPIILNFLADKVLEDIRKNKDIDPDFAEEIYHHPYMDKIRSKVVPSDFEIIKKLCLSKNDYKKVLGFSLLGKIRNLDGVFDFLLKAWNNKKLSTRVKIAIQFRLLDYKN